MSANNREKTRTEKLLKLAMWLNAQADSKGKTHGEKHHWLFVMQQVLEMAYMEIDPNEWTSQSMNVTEPDVNDIPF